MSAFRESHTRSIAKAASWRIFGTMATAAIVFAATRRWELSLAVGGAEFLSKLGLFWLHERLWNRLSFGKLRLSPCVVWFTGLSGSGKSTLAAAVQEALRVRGLPVERLDGDTVRDIFPNTGFTRDERDSHVRRVGYLASRLERHGVFVVAAFISPHAPARAFARELCENFIEVWVSTPLDVCEARDPKGLYARARRGEIRNFTGIDDPYEPPTNATLTIDTSVVPLAEATRQVLREIERRSSRA